MVQEGPTLSIESDVNIGWLCSDVMMVFLATSLGVLRGVVAIHVNRVWFVFPAHTLLI